MSSYETGYFSIENKAITELRASVFKTYCYLTSKDFKREGIWHSQQTIAKDLNVCVRTIQRHIKALKELGYISVKRRGFNQTNIYKMLRHTVEKLKEKKKEITNNFKSKFDNKGEKTKLRFNNFEGRKRSKEEWDDLENKLLGWK
jgi:DNA-binding transcriptional MocR family regulator